jgi:hypothetical protein
MSSDSASATTFCAADALLDWNTSDGLKSEVRDIMNGGFTQHTTAQRLAGIIENDEYFAQAAAQFDAISELLMALCAAENHIMHEYASRLWNQHYSWDSATADEYAKSNPPAIVRRIRAAIVCARGKSEAKA